MMDDYTELWLSAKLSQDIQKFLPSFFQKAGADGELIARSKGIKFVFKGDDDGN